MKLRINIHTSNMHTLNGHKLIVYLYDIFEYRHVKKRFRRFIVFSISLVRYLRSILF